MKICCKNGIKAKSEVINIKAYLENGLSTDPCCVVIESQVANLKLTALSEEAVSLISSNYSPYSKV